MLFEKNRSIVLWKIKCVLLFSDNLMGKADRGQVL